ncbi:hypothetical protein JR316_0008315 [Psilocybe cubensis]|uniref:Uncharacterized protein n=1 Tax=Psilocybe cubensis TaxID=181762 RepID=A0ACB8GXN3_PSICU|nr:hypothetical protein JR316_0008315 [Psilocybe cubensis]KAH9479720.1 hypothetical protein JR316_0008315 [Psilocybe cubensis]
MPHWARPSFPLWEDDPVSSESLPSPQRPERSNVSAVNTDEERGMSVDRDHSEEEEVVEALNENDEVDVRSILRAYLIYKKLIKHNAKDPRKNDAYGVPIPSYPPSPEESVVKLYIEMQTSTGPDPKNLLLLWSSPMSHPWNQQVLNLLLDDLSNYVKDKALLQLTQLAERSIGADTDVLELFDGIVSPASVKHILEKKLDNCRQRIQTSMRKVYRMQRPTDTSTPLTDNEIRAEMCKGNLELAQTNRRRERRNLRYIRRYEIIEEQLMLAVDDDARDFWRSIQALYTHFTHKDTSSDESEGECRPPLVKRVRRIRRGWISPSVSAVFHFVDKHYTPEYITGMKKRGAAPLPREVESDKVDERSKPTPELPINFYSSDLPPLVLKALRPRPKFPIPKVVDNLDTGIKTGFGGADGHLGHIFCEGCLRNHWVHNATASRSLLCPACRDEIIQPRESVDCIRKVFIISTDSVANSHTAQEETRFLRETLEKIKEEKELVLQELASARTEQALTNQRLKDNLFIAKLKDAQIQQIQHQLEQAHDALNRSSLETATREAHANNEIRKLRQENATHKAVIEEIKGKNKGLESVIEDLHKKIKDQQIHIANMQKNEGGRDTGGLRTSHIKKGCPIEGGHDLPDVKRRLDFCQPGTPTSPTLISRSATDASSALEDAAHPDMGTRENMRSQIASQNATDVTNFLELEVTPTTDNSHACIAIFGAGNHNPTTKVLSNPGTGPTLSSTYSLPRAGESSNDPQMATTLSSSGDAQVTQKRRAQKKNLVGHAKEAQGTYGK